MRRIAGPAKAPRSGVITGSRRLHQDNGAEPESGGKSRNENGEPEWTGPPPRETWMSGGL
jgi:hypothetical protein